MKFTVITRVGCGISIFFCANVSIFLTLDKIDVLYLTLYDLGERISSVWPEFRFLKKREHWKNFVRAPGLWAGRR